MLILFPPPEHGVGGDRRERLSLPRALWDPSLRFRINCSWRSSSLAWRRHVVGLKALEKLKVQEWERFVFRQTSKLPKLPSNSLVDLMMHRGTIACAEIRFKRNNSPSNFNAMCHARVMYEAAVEAIGKDVIDKSMETEDARASTCSVATQAAAHKDPRPRRGLPQYRYLAALEFLPYRL